MPEKNSNSGGRTLSSLFDDGWDVFTVPTMDAKVVSSILANADAPQNSEHIPTLGGIRKAAKEFCEENGKELLRAIEAIENRE